ncbi:hypothetical protein B0T25DRAFT_582220 [Lasiosphaeria hispida]|uniref:F-box domain-containing protein n=1 Tax=Lasiosphaeria hispida TaxID=260671 RepID=A0AAJ0HE82_9PEZI|nr:hypothetical protein B0T25DRAFT_582220 [Lasiosphaeria hispida]
MLKISFSNRDSDMDELTPPPSQEAVFPFLELPGEIRNIVYGFLLNPTNPHDMTGVSDFHPGKNFKSLMSTCRQIFTEATAFHYSTRTIRFFPTAAAMRWLHHGPGHRVRRLAIHIPMETYPATTHPSSFRGTLDLVATLAHTMPALEDLSIDATRAKGTALEYVAATPGSWVDPSVELSTIDQLPALLPRLIPHDPEMQRRIQEVLARPGAKWRFVQRTEWLELFTALAAWEREKGFYGVDLVRVLQGCRYLWNVRVVGRVDRRWMEMVAQQVVVTVHASERKGSGWVVVEPPGAGS